jgi:aconitate hydratase
VLAGGFARIHCQNLVNFGIVPLEFAGPAEYDQIQSGDILVLEDLHEKVRQGRPLIRESQSRSYV